MGCCGKVFNLLAGWANIASGRMCASAGSRMKKCRDCDTATWMGTKEYLKWIANRGVAVLTNLSQLETLEPLPKYQQDTKRRNLFCRICKCYIPAKARVEKETCPKGLWSTQ